LVCRTDVAEVFVFLAHGPLWLTCRFPAFRNKTHWSHFEVWRCSRRNGHSNLEVETTIVSRKVGNRLPTVMATYPGRTEFSTRKETQIFYSTCI
jgi:hypothetical protein